MKFGVDIDGVLRNIVAEMVRVYNKAYGGTRTVESVTHYKVKDAFPDVPDGLEFFFRENGHEVYLIVK